MARYKDAVAWIAFNDEPGDMNENTIAEYVSTLLVADVWGKDPETVARDIYEQRERRDSDVIWEMAKGSSMWRGQD